MVISEIFDKLRFSITGIKRLKIVQNLYYTSPSIYSQRNKL